LKRQQQREDLFGLDNSKSALATPSPSVTTQNGQQQAKKENDEEPEAK
jgi:hypothetical protein